MKRVLLLFISVMYMGWSNLFAPPGGDTVRLKSILRKPAHEGKGSEFSESKRDVQHKGPEGDNNATNGDSGGRAAVGVHRGKKEKKHVRIHDNPMSSVHEFTKGSAPSDHDDLYDLDGRNSDHYDLDGRNYDYIERDLPVISPDDFYSMFHRDRDMKKISRIYNLILQHRRNAAKRLYDQAVDLRHLYERRLQNYKHDVAEGVRASLALRARVTRESFEALKKSDRAHNHDHPQVQVARKDSLIADAAHIGMRLFVVGWASYGLYRSAVGSLRYMKQAVNSITSYFA